VTNGEVLPGVSDVEKSPRPTVVVCEAAPRLLPARSKVSLYVPGPTVMTELSWPAGLLPLPVVPSRST
jgi:hypothetical protein